jgi:hypothetical protein
MTVACAVPDSRLIYRLAEAKDAPTYRGGGVNRNALPTWFKTWSRVAWGYLLKELPDEDAAVLGEDAPARAEFRRLVREALLSEVTLSRKVRVGPDLWEVRMERRSLIGWCKVFAKSGPWRSVRDKKCWCREEERPGGEVVLRVALRHDVFAQVKADRALIGMGENTFTRRATRYGVGTSTRKDRPHGQSAVVLADEFVADLTSSLELEATGEGEPEGGARQ